VISVTFNPNKAADFSAPIGFWGASISADKLSIIPISLEAPMLGPSDEMKIQRKKI
jgi:hypothetical protein